MFFALPLNKKITNVIQ